MMNYVNPQFSWRGEVCSEKSPVSQRVLGHFPWRQLKHHGVAPMAGISSKKIADLRNQHGQTAQRFEYLIVKSVKNAGAQLA